MLVLPVARPPGGSRPVSCWITVLGTAQVATRSTTGCDRSVALTSTSIFGTVYEVRPRSVVWNGSTSLQLRMSLIVVEVVESITGRLPPGGLASGNTNIAILDNDHRLYADDRRTQIDMRFAKIFRFGERRLNLGVDLGNLLNTNYPTTYEDTYQYSVNNTAMGGTWNNPTAIYTPRYARLNFTVSF